MRVLTILNPHGFWINTGIQMDISDGEEILKKILLRIRNGSLWNCTLDEYLTQAWNGRYI